jgi:uncharacterized protein (TIGR02757 family)
MSLVEHSESLELLYRRYNRRRYVRGDPLECVYLYEGPDDREVAGLVAALLAYGRAGQIVESVKHVLGRMGGTPGRFLYDARPSSLTRLFADFAYRIWTGSQLTGLLLGMRRVMRRYGSLGACFQAADHGGQTVIPALQGFVNELDAVPKGKCKSLLPSPAKGSACKRLHLYLRWMVRKDQVDPGTWQAVSAAKLVVPLDTHMHRIAKALGATRRNSADMGTALEVTAAFRQVCPEDPVRYDFALTRLGIRQDADTQGFPPLVHTSGSH